MQKECVLRCEFLLVKQRGVGGFRVRICGADSGCAGSTLVI